MRIVLPLARPALLAVALFTFTNAWNEFLFAYVFITNNELMTLPVGLQSMIVGDILPWGQLMAASLIVSIPVVVLYGNAQRFLVEGLTLGRSRGSPRRVIGPDGGEQSPTGGFRPCECAGAAG